MKKYIPVVGCIMIVAAVVATIAWLLCGRDGNEVEAEVRDGVVVRGGGGQRKVSESTVHHVPPPTPVPVAEKLEEPTEPPRFEDLPPEKQAQFFADRAAIHDGALARRFGMTMEEWNHLSPKEKRILIRKGKRE